MYLDINTINNEKLRFVLAKSYDRENRKYKYYIVDCKGKNTTHYASEIRLLNPDIPYTKIKDAIGTMINILLNTAKITKIEDAFIITENQELLDYVIDKLKNCSTLIYKCMEELSETSNEHNYSIEIYPAPDYTYGKNIKNAEKVYWRFNL